MDTSRLGLGERIAAVAALVLLLSMFVFGWFSLDGLSVGGEGGVAQELNSDDLEAAAEQSGEDTSANGWESFTIIDIVLLLAALAALAVVAMRVSGNAVPSGAGAAVAGLGALAVLLMLFRLISPPDLIDALGGGEVPEGVEVDTEVGRGIGAFIGLITAAAIAYGGYLMMSGEDRRVGSRPAARQGAGPPPAA